MHGSRLGRRMVIAVAAAMALGAGTAQAATVTKAGDTITFAAAAGETNNLGVSVSGADFLFADAVDITPGAGCAVSAPNDATCATAGVTRIVINLGDRDDQLNASSIDVPVTVSGGDGYDSIDYSAATAVTVTLDGQANDGEAGRGDNIGSDVEDVAGGGGNDTLTGSAAFNRLEGSTGSDVLDAGAGEDHVLGGDGGDTINARDGFADLVDCGDGTDAVVADTLDRVASSCETVSRAEVRAGRDDVQPTVSFAGPQEDSLLRTTSATIVTVQAADDRGVASVVLLDGGRVVGTDTTAPYTFNYRPRGADVGRNALVAVATDSAGQTATAIRLVRVPRFTPRLIIGKVTPALDGVPPYQFRTTGRLRLPRGVSRAQGCSSGSFEVTFKRGRHVITTRKAKLGPKCGFSSRANFADRRRLGSGRLTVSVRFLGNDVLLPRSGFTVNVRAR